MQDDKPRNMDQTGIETAALDWLLELQEAPGDPQVLARFEAWRDADAAHARAWDEVAGVYHAIGDTQPVHAKLWQGRFDDSRAVLAEPLATLRPHPASRPRRRGHRRGGRLVRFALPAGVAAMLALAFYPSLSLRWRADAMTGTGQVQSVTLDDGSRAILAPDSAIRIAYTSGQRTVALLRGKAWFEVVHDPVHPFRVQAGDLAAIDVGTAFEVGLGEDATSVSVEEGVVRLENRRTGETLAKRLEAGQAFAITQKGAAVRSRAVQADVAAWRDGQVVVQNRPMGDVIAALRPWYGGVILVRSRALAQRRVTGVYDLHDPAKAMEALAQAYGGKVTQITPWVLILSES